MKIQPISTNSPTFGYRSLLGDCFKNGKLPTVKIGIYGHPVGKDNWSHEHIIAHSKGGHTTLDNLAIADKKINNLRGNKPIEMFLTKKMLVDYLQQFIDVVAVHNGQIFKGNDYIIGILKRFKSINLRG